MKSAFVHGPVACVSLVVLLIASPAQSQSAKCVQRDVAIGETRAGSLTASDCETTAPVRYYHIYTLEIATQSGLEIRQRPASGVNASVVVQWGDSTIASAVATDGDAVVLGTFPPGKYSVFAVGQPGAYTLSVAEADVRYPGLGMNVGVVEGQIGVLNVFANSPAAVAGIRVDDRILAINGVPSAGMSSNVASGHLRGPVGTTATVRIERAASRQPIDIVLTRALIEPPPFVRGSAQPQSPFPEIRYGTLSARFGTNTRRDADGVPYDLYIFQGVAGRRINATVTATTFSPALALYRVSDGARLDTGHGRSRASVTTLPPADDLYMLSITSLTRVDAASYSLSLAATGTYQDVNGNWMNVRFAPDKLIVSNATVTAEYRRLIEPYLYLYRRPGDGVYYYIRVIDDQTLERWRAGYHPQTFRFTTAARASR